VKAASRVLGISAHYHDSAAALVVDGRIVAAAQEERFTRRKNDESFPRLAAEFCLGEAGLKWADLDAVAFYEKPIVKFARTLETFLAVAPRGLGSFLRTMPNWFAEKLDIPGTLRRELPGLPASTPALFTTHHQAHAASAYLPSPFDSSAILTVDGVGEYATTTIGRGTGGAIELLKELRFPHSAGLLYSAFTAYCGFRVNSGEYKLMGLAPYGEPIYAARIREHLVDLRDDGSIWLNMDFFSFLHGDRMTNSRFDQLFDGPARLPESPLEERHLHVARSIQLVTEEIMLKLARHAREVTGSPNLCMAGGVALNCVANGKLLRSGLFERLWIQPAAGDAGAALGAALAVWSAENGASRPARAPGRDAMRGALLGPGFSNEEILETLRTHGAVFERFSGQKLLDRAAQLLAAENVVGWVQGRMEFGPRALGNRSILGDPRSPRMQSVMNLKVKFRESFRPFAPAILEEEAGKYFDLPAPSPYMLLVADIRECWRLPLDRSATGLDRLKQLRSRLPAVTHVDHSARVQTVSPADNPLFHGLLQAFHHLTGCPALVNTSFNVRGEPIVLTPDDAYRCFMRTEMDYLVVGDFVLRRLDQPHGDFKANLEPD